MESRGGAREGLEGVADAAATRREDDGVAEVVVVERWSLRASLMDC
jgi:hypothetical protein